MHHVTQRSALLITWCGCRVMTTDENGEFLESRVGVSLVDLAFDELSEEKTFIFGVEVAGVLVGVGRFVVGIGESFTLLLVLLLVATDPAVDELRAGLLIIPSPALGGMRLALALERSGMSDLLFRCRTSSGRD